MADNQHFLNASVYLLRKGDAGVNLGINEKAGLH